MSRKPIVRKIFDLSIEENEEFEKEAKRLDIDFIELFRRMCALWNQTRLKRKKQGGDTKAPA